MSLKRKVAFADEDETDYRRARAYAKLEELGDGRPDEVDIVSTGPPAAQSKHTLDSDEEDVPDKHEKLRFDDIAGILLLSREQDTSVPYEVPNCPVPVPKCLVPKCTGTEVSVKLLSDLL